MPSNAITRAATVTAPSVRPLEGRWWMFPHLLSLDAPLVAIAWQSAFGWALGVDIHAPEMLILFLSVWVAYAADRVLDAPPASGPARTARHRFSAAHRAVLLAAIAGALITDLFVAHALLPGRLLYAGYPLALAVLAYTAAVRWLPGFDRWGIAKEAIVGIIISAGAIWAPLAYGVSTPHALLLAAAGAWLCGWNCVAISLWEDPPRSGSPRSFRHGLLAMFRRHFHPWTVFGAILITGFGAMIGSAHGLAVGLTLGVSMLLLRVLDTEEFSINDDLRRVLADVVLLVPAVALLLPR